MTTAAGRTGLGDLLDRLLDSGAVVAGEVAIGLADVELLFLDLRVFLTGVDSASRRGELPPELLHHAPRGTAPALSDPRLPELPRRLDLDDQRPEYGVIGLVLLLVEVLRELIQGQAVARLHGGSLNDDEVERLGAALRRLDERIDALRRFVSTDQPRRLDAALEGSSLR
jgi:hypothetical protein